MNQDKTILLIGTFLSKQGGRRGVSEDWRDQLQARGWQVIAASDHLGRLARLADMLATTWWHRKRYGGANVEVYSGPAFCWAEAVCGLLRLLRHPYALTLHGGNLPAFARRQPRRVLRLLRSAEAVMCPSGFLAEAMWKYRRDIRIVPNGIDLQRFRYRLRANLEPRLVWLRAFHRVYDAELAVRVAKVLSKDFPGVRLTLCGADKHDGTLENVQRLIRELGMAENVHIRGAVHRADIPEILDQAEILLNTARVDNTPVSVIEAMASGLCVVSTNVGGLPYLIDNGRDGMLVTPGDENAMAAAVSRLLRSPGLARTLSVNARRRALSYDWTLVTPEVEAILRQLGQGACGSNSGAGVQELVR